MDISNLSQLKRAMTTGARFTVIDHWKPELIGNIREVRKVTGNGVYTGIFNDPTNDQSTCNGGKGSFMSFDKASHYVFNNDSVEWYKESVGSENNRLIMKFGCIEIPAQF